MTLTELLDLQRLLEQQERLLHAVDMLGPGDRLKLTAEVDAKWLLQVLEGVRALVLYCNALAEDRDEWKRKAEEATS